jgi:hypothetical protein
MIFILITARERTFERLIEACADLVAREKEVEVRQDLIAVGQKMEQSLQRWRNDATFKSEEISAPSRRQAHENSE